METAFVGPVRAGPGLAMQRAKTGRALNSIRARGPGRAGPGREVYGPGRQNPARADLWWWRVYLGIPLKALNLKA